jgi:hypothetical protein
MAERARLQIKGSADPERWDDVSSSTPIPIQLKETVPTDSSNTNGSLTLAYTDGVLTSITKTIGSDSYVKTLSYTDGVLTGVSAWVES